MEKLLNKLIKDLKEICGDRLSSVFLYGSCATEECSKSFSDINLMVIIKGLKALDLKKSHVLAKNFVKTAKCLPMFMDKDEWFNSTDVYPIEYSDIKERYKILYGDDLVDCINVDRKHLRLQCEHEVKNLLIRLRQTYLANAFDKKSIRNLIQSSSKTFMVIFRAVIRLSNEEVPTKHEEVINLFSKIINAADIIFDKDLFLKILEFRKDKRLIRDAELEVVIQELIDSINYVLKYVDKIDI